MPRRGQVRKRENGKYLARVFAGTSSDGKRHWVSKTFEKKKDADAWLAEQLNDKAQGKFQAPSKETLGEYLRRWLSEAAANRVRERTLSDYTTMVEKYIVPELGHLKTRDLRPDHVQRFYNTLAENNGPGITQHVHRVLHAALNQAVKWGLVTRNVSGLVEVPKGTKREIRPLTPNEARRFLEAVQNDRYFAYFTLLLDAGLRPGEALALTWSDIDMDAGTVHITKALAGKERLYIAPPKTRKSRRSLPIMPGTMAALKLHRSRINEERLKFKGEWENPDLVFPNELGGFASERNISQRHFKPALRAAGLPETMRVYDLRHTAATLLMAANIHPKVVAERLGHSTTNLTLDTYSHVAPSMQEQVVKTLEALLGAPQDSKKSSDNN